MKLCKINLKKREVQEVISELSELLSIAKVIIGTLLLGFVLYTVLAFIYVLG